MKGNLLWQYNHSRRRRKPVRISVPPFNFVGIEFSDDWVRNRQASLFANHGKLKYVLAFLCTASLICG